MAKKKEVIVEEGTIEVTEAPKVKCIIATDYICPSCNFKVTLDAPNDYVEYGDRLCAKDGALLRKVKVWG